MGFKHLREFQINIFGLSNKLHEFEFEIDNKLFAAKENSLVEKGSGQCKLSLKKSETMMNLHFEINAEVELICDRSLDPFEYPIAIEEDIIIKFGEDDYELSEEVFVIRKDSPSFNVGDFIYEFISLAVPMKKLHPRFADEDEQEDLIYTSGGEESPEESKDDEVDPRWEALKKLKD
ncbi:DUF177 domain-containing protein [Marinoscillum sp. MHG1-6]|uniref:YceD family protein n=1 Tax=Marinoscillum sp. MHG1-6 TaxID=2959627 RepID=UPI002158246D|nr:DUF177 domain-containing protein [Marinoscillum sp. MHG1-6]